MLADIRLPKSYTVEAICAIPHPVPTHSLAASVCMQHLITGSEDGYIRNYDIFTGVNGKVFLTAPQRHHCGVMEGLMKAAQLRCWWENPSDYPQIGSNEDTELCAPYSLLMHSDALWALSGSNVCIVLAFYTSTQTNTQAAREHQFVHRASRTRPLVSCYAWPPWPGFIYGYGTRRKGFLQCRLG